MSTTVARLFPLASLAFLVACTESRDPLTAPDPGITANHSVTQRLEAPSPRGYPLMAYDPVKDRVYEVGGYSTS